MTVKFKMTTLANGFTTTEPYKPDFTPGQIIFVRDIGKIYVDYDG